jgi:GT2 family glycosyltransferase
MSQESCAPVSIVIAAHTERRWTQLTAAVNSALAQQPAPAAVVVVVDHNEPMLARVRTELPHVTAVSNRYERGASGSRNSGVEVTDTPFVAFLDDDEVARPDWLALLTAPFIDPAVIGTGGASEPIWEGRRPNWFPDEFGWVIGVSFEGMPTATAPIRNVWAGNMVVRRTAFEAVGGFRIGFGKVGDTSRPEDTDLCIRMAAAAPGGHWLYVPAAVVGHHVPASRSTFPFFLRRSYEESRGKVEMARLLRREPAPKAALTSEREYIRKILPRGVGRGLGQFLGHADPGGAARALAIVAGMSAAGAGLLHSLATTRSGRPRRAGRRHPPATTGGAALETSGSRAESPHIGHTDHDEIPGVVLDLEVSAEVQPVGARDASGRRRRQAWFLVRIFTEPVGLVAVDIPDAGLSAAAVLAAAVDACHDELAVRLAKVGAKVDDLGVMGLVAGTPPPVVTSRAALPHDTTPTTVVICTRERPEGLRRCLESVVAQQYPRFKVLVVDNAPTTDRTARVVAEFVTRLPIEYAVEPRPGLSRARNRALALIPDGFVAWLDDDEVADEHWLAETMRAFHDRPDAAAVSGAVVPAELDTQPQLWFEQFGGHSKGRGFHRAVFSPATAHEQSPLYPLPPFGVGANMAFRVDALRAIGGFDEALGAGTPAKGSEDTLAFTRILLSGGSIVYQPSALVSHFHRTSLPELRSQLHGYGTGLAAYYLALVMDDPKVLWPLLRLVPRAVRDLTSKQSPITATLGHDFPRELIRANRRGMLAGPFRYLRGRYARGSRQTPARLRGVAPALRQTP